MHKTWLEREYGGIWGLLKTLLVVIFLSLLISTMVSRAFVDYWWFLR